eukprot:GGOE01037473.1.p1 GENE.GGOE01037473.1~~GGOE01037473.1.p1  ORF type:complete len:490 (+),score=112.02 GGOE01037473.1:91-1560(+)
MFTWGSAAKSASKNMALQSGVGLSSRKLGSSAPSSGESLHFAYLHGFLSGPTSQKGLFLQSVFQRHGQHLDLLDLNRGNIASLTYTSATEVVLEYAAAHPEGKVCLIGSSFGGYIAARCAGLLPERVDRVMLLCPGFDLATRWPIVYGAEEMEQWKTTKFKAFTTSQGEEVDMPYSFIEDTQQHPAYPDWGCPTVILQGQADTVVPEEYIQGMLRANAGLSARCHLYVVDDDHALTTDPTLHLVEKVAVEFLLPKGRRVQCANLQLEVERKFPVANPEELEQHLGGMGACLKVRERFEDSYWDTKDMALLRHDHWLRQRGGLWELKRPSDFGQARASLVTTYEEIADDVTAIGEALSPLLGMPGADVAAALRACRAEEANGLLAPFAQFLSERVNYEVEGVTLVMDRAEYQEEQGTYCVVEVEQLVRGTEGQPPTEDRVREAGQRIHEIAQLVGLQAQEGRVAGKLEYFLKRARPAHWAALKELLGVKT